MSQNPGIERAIYVEAFQQQRAHHYVATRGDTIHRIPVSPEELWNDVSSVPSIPPAALLNDLQTFGVVMLRKNIILSGVPGASHKFCSSNPLAPIQRVIPATFGDTSPGAGSVAPTLAAAPTSATGYTPAVVDANGVIHLQLPAVWAVDGLNHIVEFPYGVPSYMPPPFLLTYFEYIGAVGGGAGRLGPPARLDPLVLPGLPARPDSQASPASPARLGLLVLPGPLARPDSQASPVSPVTPARLEPLALPGPLARPALQVSLAILETLARLEPLVLPGPPARPALQASPVIPETLARLEPLVLLGPLARRALPGPPARPALQASPVLLGPPARLDLLASLAQLDLPVLLEPPVRLGPLARLGLLAH